MQRFQPVCRWHAQIVEPARIVEETQLAQRDRLNIGWQAAAVFSSPNRLRLAIAKLTIMTDA